MKQSEAISFIDRLQVALAQVEIPSERDFCIPGTDYRIDLYLPRLPRAALELKTDLSPESFRSALNQASQIQRVCKEELGSSFKTILLCFCNDVAKFEQHLDIPDGIICFFIEGNPNSKDSASAAASQIQLALETYRKDTFNLGVASAVTLSAVSMAVPTLTPLIASVGLLAAFGNSKFATYLGDIASSSAQQRKSTQGKFDNDSLEISSVSYPPPSEDVKKVAIQVATIMETFRELAPTTHLVLVHEMEYLLEEFKLGHFTACAMRGGRSLESVIYEMSRRWDIDVQDASFGKLLELQITLDRIGELIGDYQVSDGAKRKDAEAKLNSALTDLNTKAMMLAISVKDGQQTPNNAPRSESAPRPIVALLKKIKMRYGHLDGTGKSIKALFESDRNTVGKSLIDRVLRTRNRAAHADVNGVQQEIDKDSIIALLDDINVVILKLSNVDIAIRKNQVENSMLTTGEPSPGLQRSDPNSN